MNTLIKQCRRLGVRLRIEGGALAYDAPKGTLTADLLAQLRTHKSSLLEALAAPAVTEEAADASQQDSLKAHKALRRRSAPKVPRGLEGYTPSGARQALLQDTLMARQIRAMNEGRPLPLVDPDLSSAFYEIVGFFEERLAAVQRHPPAEMHLNTGPPTIAAVRDAVKATLAYARARGFAQREVIEALEGYPEAARFLPAELGQPPAPKGLGGVSPELAARLSAEDRGDIAAGDVLKVLTPATPDATLADITFSLAGTR